MTKETPQSSDAKGELEAFEKSVAPPVAGESLETSAKDRIKLVRERGFGERFKGAFTAGSGWKKATTWSREGVYKEEMATKIEKIAKERIQKARKALQKNTQGTGKKLDSLAEKSKPSILLLRTQRDICDEIGEGLKAEIEEKSALREVYDKVGEILGENEGLRASDLKATEIPTTEALQKKMAMVSTIKEEIEGELDTSPEGKLTEQVAQLDGELRKLLALSGANIDLDGKLYTCLTGKDRTKAVEDFVKELKEQVQDPHVRAACCTIVKRITGVDPGIQWFSRWYKPYTGQEKNAATAANFYRQKEMAKESLNDGDLAERMRQLQSAAGLQKVILKIGGGNPIEMRKVTTSGQFVRLRAGDGFAVIDTKENSLVIKDPGATAVITTYKLKEGVPANAAEKKSAICFEEKA